MEIPFTHYNLDDAEERKIDVFLLRNQRSEEMVANLILWCQDHIRRSHVVFGGDPSLQLSGEVVYEYVDVQNPEGEYPYHWVENLNNIPKYTDRVTGKVSFWNRLTDPTTLEFAKDWYLRKFSENGKKWIVCDNYNSFKKWFGDRKCCLYICNVGK